MKKGKIVRPIHVSMKVYLTLLVLVQVGIMSLATGLVGALLQYLGVSFAAWQALVVLGISALLGSLLTGLVNRLFFAPISRLGQAMGQVAKGNFHVRMEEPQRFRELQQICDNFNLMAQELGNTEILQTDFVSNVSHEFKTPINAIEGYATLLQDCEGVTAEQQVYVEKILFNTRRLSKLVGNILLLSKVDNQAIQSRKRNFSLDEQIRQVIVALEPEWVAKDIDLNVDLEPVCYFGDDRLLSHVWSNLIGNAIKFSPQGGYVGITLRKEGTVFTVEDRGPGIPPESLERIFHRFYQSDSSHQAEGNGLGLALVKQILTTLGGQVAVENLETGCRFTVKLP